MSKLDYEWLVEHVKASAPVLEEWCQQSAGKIRDRVQASCSDFGDEMMSRIIFAVQLGCLFAKSIDKAKAQSSKLALEAFEAILDHARRQARPGTPPPPSPN